MRSKVAQRILDRTPEHVKIFVRLYGFVVVRLHDLIEQKNITQKSLAKSMGKQPSEISKWLSGEHNFTLKSLAKLEAELGEPIITVPKRDELQLALSQAPKRSLELPNPKEFKPNFTSGKIKKSASQHHIV